MVKINIIDDITRLYRMHLDAVYKLKSSFPSENVEERMFKKRVKQLREQRPKDSSETLNSKIDKSLTSTSFKNFSTDFNDASLNQSSIYITTEDDFILEEIPCTP
jgi:hypothetical protein